MNNLMKIFMMLIFLMFTFNSAVFAQNEVKFIYVHGTNDNCEEKKVEFTNYVNGLQAQVVTAFGNSEVVNKYLLENGKYTVSPEPIAFYWGAESKKDLNLLADWLDITKFFSPKLAQTVRTMIAHSFHDAIWIQKYNNMKPVIDKLHEQALQITANGDKYVLLGHSAGSFITYEYFLYKFPFVSTEELLTVKKIPAAKMAEIKKIGYRDTCIDALIDAGVVVFERDDGFYIVNDNLTENYKKLESVEKNSCMNLNYATGIINFGSPLSLFYSGFGNDADVSTESLITALLKNDTFFLNLNFAEDPLGFPVSGKNDYESMFAWAKEIKTANGITKSGFVYDKSDIRSNRAVFNSHMAYWQKSKFFAKEMVKAYEAGIKLFQANN